MKELVKKLSKVFLVLCMSMVLMMGSAYANPLCKMKTSFIDLPCPLSSPSPICSATVESRFGRNISSIDIGTPPLIKICMSEKESKKLLIDVQCEVNRENLCPTF